MRIGSQKGDTIIDGGNSHYKESIRHARKLEERGINFLDAGMSGGPEGARKGACIMVGGRREIFNFRIESQINPGYTGQILSALRHQFGGHEVFKK